MGTIMPNRDAWLHALGAALMVLAGWWLLERAAVGFTIGFWIGREWAQAEKGYFFRGGPWNWSAKKMWEAGLPAVTAVLLGVMLP